MIKMGSWSEGNSAIQSKVVDLKTGKVVKKRASSNQRPQRTSVTPQKLGQAAAKSKRNEQRKFFYEERSLLNFQFSSKEFEC